MAPLSFSERVVKLEQQMNALQQLPKKVDDLRLQVSQLHAQMTREFSAIRDEMAAESAAVRAEMGEADCETRRQMRLLHEDLVARIAPLHQGLLPAKPRRSKRRRR